MCLSFVLGPFDLNQDMAILWIWNKSVEIFFGNFIQIVLSEDDCAQASIMMLLGILVFRDLGLERL